MGEALLDLEQLLSSKKEKLTPQEANILLSWKSKAFRDFTASALAGGTATWAATWKLSKPLRVNLSAGATAFVGLWIFRRSLYSCVDQILTLDGSILQKELANIMVTKYPNDPLLMQLISKHFYSEKIFDDSTSNNPKLRWRYRNFFSDNVVYGHRKDDHDSYDYSEGDSHDDSYNNSQGESEIVTDSERTNLEAKHIFKKACPDIMSEIDPLECLFGYGAPLEEIHHPHSPNKPSGTNSRGHRRFHRRRRVRNHNHEDLSNSEHAAAV
ncbi:uncharacterized protein LOC133299116 [Gastrolobium bilobum]|uniref:uncharacterized protein LOC133299116 n=1 Tax=Gastrolobium bilobum TaxID=150636 RepID=UPI002AAF3409|nr:uncharacterized protein LOC133299116 [Gastrolobium bilobum]